VPACGLGIRLMAWPDKLTGLEAGVSAGAATRRGRGAKIGAGME